MKHWFLACRELGLLSVFRCSAAKTTHSGTHRHTLTYSKTQHFCVCAHAAWHIGWEVVYRSSLVKREQLTLEQMIKTTRLRLKTGKQVRAGGGGGGVVSQGPSRQPARKGNCKAWVGWTHTHTHTHTHTKFPSRYFLFVSSVTACLCSRCVFVIKITDSWGVAHHSWKR